MQTVSDDTAMRTEIINAQRLVRRTRRVNRLNGLPSIAIRSVAIPVNMQFICINKSTSDIK